MILSIDQIRMDGGTQPRGCVDPEVIDTYQDAMEEGAKFPPVDVFYDGREYWLADGFHRVRAKLQTGADEIECSVHQGTQQDAQWFSFGANKTNGLYRSNADKQRAIQAALKHPKSSGLSDAAIGKHCGVSQRTVSTWRDKLESTQKVSKSDSRTGRDGRTINTSKIGRKKTRAEVAAKPTAPEPTATRVSVIAALPTITEMPARKQTAVEPDIAVQGNRICEAIRVIVERGITARQFAQFLNGPDWAEALNGGLRIHRDGDRYDSGEDGMNCKVATFAAVCDCCGKASQGQPSFAREATRVFLCRLLSRMRPACCYSQSDAGRRYFRSTARGVRATPQKGRVPMNQQRLQFRPPRRSSSAVARDFDGRNLALAFPSIWARMVIDRLAPEAVSR